MALKSASRSVGILSIISSHAAEKIPAVYFATPTILTSKLTVFSLVTGVRSRFNTIPYYDKYALVAFATLLFVATAVVYHCLSTERSTYTERSGAIQVTHHNVVFQLGPLRFVVAEHYRRRDVPGAHGTGSSRARAGEAAEL